MSEKAIHQGKDVPEVKTGEDNIERPDSTNFSEKTISDDDEIDYSIKPEFYSPNLDAKDELWVQKRHKGHYSDAILSCPACFTTVCLECQREGKGWQRDLLRYVGLVCYCLNPDKKSKVL